MATVGAGGLMKPMADWPGRCSSFFATLIDRRRHRRLPQQWMTMQLPPSLQDKVAYRQMKGASSQNSLLDTTTTTTTSSKSTKNN